MIFCYPCFGPTFPLLLLALYELLIGLGASALPFPLQRRFFCSLRILPLSNQSHHVKPRSA